MPQRRLHLPFTASFIASMKSAQLILALLVAVGAGIAAWCWVQSHSLEGLAVGYEAASARQQRANALYAEEMKRVGLMLTETQMAAVRREVTFANQIAEKREFSWIELLHNLENGVPPNVSISSVRLSFQDSTITLQGMVKTMQDLNALVVKLQTEGSFRKVVLAQHLIKGDGSNGRVTDALSHDTDRKGSARLGGVEFIMTVAYRPNF
jgi:Tfp pilus assembly protein PilN